MSQKASTKAHFRGELVPPPAPPKHTHTHTHTSTQTVLLQALTFDLSYTQVLNNLAPLPHPCHTVEHVGQGGGRQQIQSKTSSQHGFLPLPVSWTHKTCKYAHLHTRRNILFGTYTYIKPYAHTKPHVLYTTTLNTLELTLSLHHIPGLFTTPWGP